MEIEKIGGEDFIKTIKIKVDDWAELSRLAALKQLTNMQPTPLHDVISDLIEYKEKLKYYNSKNMCKLGSYKVTK